MSKKFPNYTIMRDEELKYWHKKFWDDLNAAHESVERRRQMVLDIQDEMVSRKISIFGEDDEST